MCAKIFYKFCLLLHQGHVHSFFAQFQTWRPEQANKRGKVPNLESSIMSVRRWGDIFGVSNLVRYAYCDIVWLKVKCGKAVKTHSILQG